MLALLLLAIVPVGELPEHEVYLVEYNRVTNATFGGSRPGEQVIVWRPHGDAWHVQTWFFRERCSDPVRFNGRWVIVVRTDDGRLVRIVAHDLFSSRTPYDPEIIDRQHWSQGKREGLACPIRRP